MTGRSSLARSWRRRRVVLTRRSKVLIAGLVGGGLIVVFPAATVLVVTFVFVLLATLGKLAWMGTVALASIAAALLIVPVVLVAAGFGGRAMVRRVMRMRSSAGDVAHEAQPVAMLSEEDSNDDANRTND